jgi:hypothetical protein
MNDRNILFVNGDSGEGRGAAALREESKRLL